ncbi:hypothetical protein B0J13DRAFT_417075, partial [Dactylonectria estremocensis]
IQADHPIFSQPVPPIPGLIDVPLVLYRVGTQSAHRADLDRRSYVGTVVVARKDMKPLLSRHIEGVWMYRDRILDLFGKGEGAPRILYNRQAFDR